jgi:hypothetical protein
VKGWQREYQKAEDELDDPRSLALPDWETLTSLADALVARSHGQFTVGTRRDVRRLHGGPHR